MSQQPSTDRQKSNDTSGQIRVLVVDDSAFMRHIITHGLNAYPQIRVVGSARDGYEALAAIQNLQPHVVTLDVEMPRLDGISTLREVMRTNPLPVVMLSSLTREGASATIQALAMGAVDFIAKPSHKAQVGEIMDEVAEKVLRAAQARVMPRPGAVPNNAHTVTGQIEKKSRPRLHNEPIVLIGASTGGPRALHSLIPALPADLPASIVVVQHMPAGFTRSLAERLDNLSVLPVREVEPDDALQVGRVLVARGGFHLTFNHQGLAVLNQNPPIHGVRPAIDVTLASLAERFGQRVLAVILTGMGSDGTAGAALTRVAGGQVLAEAESSCVVWGMPRSVSEAGLAQQVLPLESIAPAITRMVTTGWKAI